MKISKLFHWLYALVMFLPILIFLPNALYYSFNEHATNSQSTNINYKYQSNEVNSLNDLHAGYVYELDIDTYYSSDILSDSDGYISLIVIDVYSFNFNNFSIGSLDQLNTELHGNSNSFIEFDIYYEACDFFVYLNQDDDFLADIYFENPSSESFTLQGIFILNDYLNVSDYRIFSYTDYNEIESVDIITEDTITNKMYQGWQQVWDLPIFNWTSDTYFTQPFTFISGLFGWQSNNTISYCLSYWFSISIIWLVFDVMLYVPLLVHRWLDKASLS